MVHISMYTHTHGYIAIPHHQFRTMPSDCLWRGSRTFVLEHTWGPAGETAALIILYRASVPSVYIISDCFLPVYAFNSNTYHVPVMAR